MKEYKDLSDSDNEIGDIGIDVSSNLRTEKTGNDLAPEKEISEVIENLESEESSESVELHILKENDEIVPNQIPFSELKLSGPLLEKVQHLYSDQLTSTQIRVIPKVLEEFDRDLIVRAKTGTGKSLSFLLPIVQKYCFMTELRDRKNCRKELGLRTCILAPTRELCIQIHEELNSILSIAANTLVNHKVQMNRIVCSLLIGGDRKKSEKARIRKGLNVIIATPGRLLDHLKTTENLDFSDLQVLVCDEADRLMELGFEKTVYDIFDIIKEQKKVKSKSETWSTWLFSATMPQMVERLVNITLVNPQRITCSKEYEAPELLVQAYSICPAKLRFTFLVSVVECMLSSKPRIAWMSNLSGCADDKGYNKKLVVFVSTCKMVDFYKSAIAEMVPGSYSCLYALHGEMAQKERSHAYLTFIASEKSILITTDVSSRGLEFRGVDWILQMDPPIDIQSYIHRIGRTARLDRKGSAILLVQEHETKFLDYLNKKGLLMKNLDYRDVISKETFGDYSYADELNRRLENFIESDKDYYNSAANAYMSFMRAYASHPNKHIFSVKNLHYGHLAKSFGIKDSPSRLTDRVLNERKRSYEFVERRKQNNKRPRNGQRVSEFDSGVQVSSAGVGGVQFD
eukprot:NODE_597_length_6263_cov_0.206035.p2 type:complete len:628 gc:universal NODE_597_length_6263_cov_0.206035:3531-5414(+)